MTSEQNNEKTKKSVILDVKPWDDETDLVEMERLVRSVELDGLSWGGPGQLVPLAFGIQKLQIACIIDGDKVSIDDLLETITEQFEDHVQSVELVSVSIL